MLGVGGTNPYKRQCLIPAEGHCRQADFGPDGHGLLSN